MGAGGGGGCGWGAASGGFGEADWTLGDSHPRQHRSPDSPDVAYIAGSADGCDGAGRRIISAQFYADRVPALGDLSRAGGFRNEPEYSGGRYFLAAAAVSRGSGGGGDHHGGGVVRLCVRGGSGASGMARRADAGHIFRGAAVVSRTQHDERNWSGGAGSPDCRSACFVWRQFSADVSGCLYHRGDWIADSGAYNLALRAGITSAARCELRFADRSRGGAISAGFAVDRGTAEEIRWRPTEPELAGYLHAGGHWNWRIDFYFGADAGGTGSADGIPLSSRHHDGDAG